MALRVARGLFRLWLVLSVLWIVGVGVVTWLTFPQDEYCADEQHCRSWKADDKLVADPKASEKPPWDIPDFDPSKPHRVLRDMERRLAIRDASLLAFLPPAFMLALGSALV